MECSLNTDAGYTSVIYTIIDITNKMEGMFIQNRIYKFHFINIMVSKLLFNPVFFDSRIAVSAIISIMT